MAWFAAAVPVAAPVLPAGADAAGALPVPPVAAVWTTCAIGSSFAVGAVPVNSPLNVVDRVVPLMPDHSTTPPMAV
jgi:hypothetical protein